MSMWSPTIGRRSTLRTRRSASASSALSFTSRSNGKTRRFPRRILLRRQAIELDLSERKPQLEAEHVQHDQSHDNSIVRKRAQTVTLHERQKGGDDDPGDEKGHEEPNAERQKILGAKNVAGLPHLVTRGDDERREGEKKRIFRRDFPVKTDQ